MSRELHLETAPSIEERRHRDRVVLWRSFGVALLVHLLVLLLWRTDRPLLSPEAAAGPRSGDPNAAAGSMQTITIRTPPTRPIVPPELPIPSLDPVEPVEFDDETQLAEASLAGMDPGELEGPGRADGTGEGDGGTADQGLFRTTVPIPRGLVYPPAADELKDRETVVWVWVDVTGRVVADSTVIRPPTSDGDLNRRLAAEASEWIFEPARQAGEPVGAWFSYRIGN